jgi:hypothetical protein
LILRHALHGELPQESYEQNIQDYSLLFQKRELQFIPGDVRIRMLGLIGKSETLHGRRLFKAGVSFASSRCDVF